MSELFSILLQVGVDPHSKSFKILLVASEIGVTLIVFYGFYLVFNSFVKKMNNHKKENPEIVRQRRRPSPEISEKDNEGK